MEAILRDRQSWHGGHDRCVGTAAKQKYKTDFKKIKITVIPHTK